VPRRAVLRGCLRGLLLLCAASMPALAAPGDGAAAPAEGRPLVLEPVLNGRATGVVGAFIERDGVLRAAPEELRALGIAVPDGAPRAADGTVRLDALPGLRAVLDEARQQLRVTAADRALVANEIGAGIPGGARPVPPSETATGALLNYDINATRAGGRALGAGLAEARAFGPWGIASLSGLGYLGLGGGGGYGVGAGLGGRQRVVRLDATWTLADPEALRQLRVGDVVAGGLPWTRPVRLGGGQVARDFGIRPDLVTFPLPSIGGSAAVPSTVDVLVDGVRRASGSTEPGPFVVRQLPLVTGAGEVSVVVRDALGRESVSTLPFYVSGSLLAPGLSAYSAEVGALRRNYGLLSDDYGTAVAIGTLRRGVNEWLTLEAHAEAARGLVMGGAGAVAGIGALGVASASAAASRASDEAVSGSRLGRILDRRGGGGWQFGLGFERITRGLSLSGSVTWASARYADAAALDGQSFPRRIARATVGIALDDASSFAVAFAGVKRDRGRNRRVSVGATGGEALAADGPFTGLGVRGDDLLLAELPSTAILSATYTRRVFRDASVYATAFADLQRSGEGGRGAGQGAMIGLILPIGGRSSAGASASLDGDRAFGTLQASQAAALPGEFGWRLYASEGAVGRRRDDSRQLAEAEYAGQRGRVLVGVDRQGDEVALRAAARGAVTWAGGGLFLSDYVNSAFAVVSTDGVADVPVLHENRPVGRTDSSGLLLVPGLRAWESNKLAIAPEALPADAVVGDTERYLRPRERAGAVARFAVSRGGAARVRLTDAAGKPLPLGSVAVLAASGERAPIGHDGETFLRGLGPDNALEVGLAGGGRCAVRFPFAPDPDTLPLIGPFPCR